MGYRNFKTAIYCTVRDVKGIVDNEHFERDFGLIEKHIQLDKVYLETYRGGHLISKEMIEKAQAFFGKKGIQTSGGITTDISNGWEFQSLCYSNPEHLERLKQIVQFTAGLFDEIILDDFYFSNCKCELCIRAKGEQSWSQFRTGLLQKVAQEIILKNAKEINPKVKVIIKFPNWYDDYQNTGYNLQEEPQVFDGIYSGTETRDPHYSQQNLPRYLSYFLMRYLENVKPGHNGGGWFDTFNCTYNLGAYAEQCNLTLFAKAKEVTLFCLGLLLYRDSIFVPIAGYVFEKADQLLGELGDPIGIPCYKPYHSSGENYLHNYLGMLGLPLEPTPEFPKDQPVVLLTESAQTDTLIIEKIKQQLKNGKTIIITSGLLTALAGKGFETIAEVYSTNRKVAVDEFAGPMYECAYINYSRSTSKIIIPQLEYATNDCVPVIVGLAQNKSYPLLLQIKYGLGQLFILTIPDHFGDLYHLPAEVLNLIRETLMNCQKIRLEGPAQIGLFYYSNDTFIVESFLPYLVDCRIIAKDNCQLVDLVQQSKEAGTVDKEGARFEIKLAPATYRVFRVQPKKFEM